jgi:hypothetical protein
MHVKSPVAVLYYPLFLHLANCRRARTREKRNESAGLALPTVVGTSLLKRVVLYFVF